MRSRALPQGESGSVLHRSGIIHRLAALFARRSVKEHPLEGEDCGAPESLRSYCSARAASRRPAYAAILKPRSAGLPHAVAQAIQRAWPHPTTAGFHGGGQIIRPPRPFRYSDARSRLAVFSGRAFPALPRAPRPKSRKADGLQLASSWTRDGSILTQARRAGISLTCRPKNANGRDKPGHRESPDCGGAL